MFGRGSFRLCLNDEEIFEAKTLDKAFFYMVPSKYSIIDYLFCRVSETFIASSVSQCFSDEKRQIFSTELAIPQPH
jgi:hypothetical protein